jgi:hypothetical protein
MKPDEALPRRRFVGSVPTSRKEREKWGTQQFLTARPFLAMNSFI